MISGKTIAKNVGVMMASQLSTWVLSFILAIFLPRYLGAELVGVVAVANSIWLIMLVLIGFGMDTHLTKSVARDPSQTGSLLGTSLAIRTVFFLIASAGVAIYALLMGYDSTMNTVLFIEGIFYLLAAYNGAYVAALVGLERMEFVSVGNIASKVVLTGLSLLLIFFDAGLYPIVAVNVVAMLVANVIGFVALSRQHPLRINLNLLDWRAMISSSSIYLVSALAMVVYQQIDKPFISMLVDTKTVGWYGTAMNLFGTLMFLPVMFGTVIFPSLARSYATGDAKLNLIAQRSFDLMFLMSVPVGFGMIVVGKPLIALLYGPEFAPSGGILMILGAVLIFTYLNTILGQLLISIDRTGPWNVVMIVAIILTLPIDFVLVPWTHQIYGNGALGGALAFLITECIMVIAAILLLPRHTLQWSNVRTAVLTLLAGLIMMAASWWFRDTMMLLSIVIGAATYTSTVLLLRIIPREELLLIRNAVMSVVSRLRGNNEAAAGVGN